MANKYVSFGNRLIAPVGAHELHHSAACLDVRGALGRKSILHGLREVAHVVRVHACYPTRAMSALPAPLSLAKTDKRPNTNSLQLFVRCGRKPNSNACWERCAYQPWRSGHWWCSRCGTSPAAPQRASPAHTHGSQRQRVPTLLSHILPQPHYLLNLSRALTSIRQNESTPNETQQEHQRLADEPGGRCRRTCRSAR
eukprot:3517968-Rhodomonas_salina.2